MLSFHDYTLSIAMDLALSIFVIQQERLKAIYNIVMLQ